MRALTTIVMSLLACGPGTTAPDFEHPDQREVGVLGQVTCARSRGYVACSGSDERGLSGDGKVDGASSQFVRVPGVHDAVALALAPNESVACVVRRDRSVWCWGLNLGVLGRAVPRFDGTDVARSVARPTHIEGLPPTVELAVHVTHACAIDQTGAVRCWGVNVRGEVTDPRHDPSDVVPEPAVVPLPAPARSLHLQYTQSCALLTTQEVYCWGGSVPGTGDAVVPAFGPTRVARGTTRVWAASRGETCVETTDGRRCWPIDDEQVLAAMAAQLPPRREVRW